MFTKETVKRMPSAKANEPNRPVKQELFLRSKVATWRLFARLLSSAERAIGGVRPDHGHIGHAEFGEGAEMNSFSSLSCVLKNRFRKIVGRLYCTCKRIVIGEKRAKCHD